MGDIVLAGSTSGTTTLTPAAVSGTTTLTLPATTGTVLTTTSPKAGNIIQVVSTNLTTTFSVVSATFTDITGLSVSITPSSASNKVFVILDMVGSGVAATSVAQFRLVRDSTVIDAGASAGSRSLGIASVIPVNNVSPSNIGANFLDSPATTSATTYKVQGRTSTGDTLYVNFAVTDGDDINRIRTASTITVMEVAG